MEPRVGRTAYRPLVAVITCHTMKIINLDASRLATYVRTQVEHFFPMGEDAQLRLIDAHLDEAWAKSGNGSSGAKSKFKFDALAYGNWYGNIKFSDRDQMQHLADYVEANMPHHRADGSTEWVKPRKRA